MLLDNGNSFFMPKALEQRWLAQGKNCNREVQSAMRLGLLVVSTVVYEKAGSDFAPILLQDLEEYPSVTEASSGSKIIIPPKILVEDVNKKVTDLTFSSWMARVLTVYTRFQENDLKLFIEEGDKVVEIYKKDFTGLNN